VWWFPGRASSPRSPEEPTTLGDTPSRIGTLLQNATLLTRDHIASVASEWMDKPIRELVHKRFQPLIVLI
jgi:hypothetical protein